MPASRGRSRATVSRWRRPACCCPAGETTVTVRGSGRGGRSVEFLLALAVALNGEPAIYALAGDTDGVDGTEDNAGAIVTPDTLARAAAAGVDAKARLADNDGYTFFSALGDLVITGPTLTNVNDFRADSGHRRHQQALMVTTELLEPAATAATDKRELVRRLAGALPPGCLLHEAEDTRPFECDGLTAYRTVPMVVALPETEAQVCAVMRICHAARVPVVARGAGTGLSGGALPHAHGVLLAWRSSSASSRSTRVARIARVQPGVRNLAISEAAAPIGLYYAPDPSSQIACSIGGNVAENSGGVHCLKYGLTVHNILKLRVVTDRGRNARDRRATRWTAPGYDLLALLTGSEGLLGVVTEVTRQAAAEAANGAGRARGVRRRRRARATRSPTSSLPGIIPAGLEMMDQLATARGGAVRPRGLSARCASDPAVRVRRHGRGSGERDRAGHRSDARVRRDRDPRLARRSRAAASSGRGARRRSRRWGASCPTTTAWTAPSRASTWARCCRRIAELSREYGLRCANVFHAGDGNLHPLILYDANDAGPARGAPSASAPRSWSCASRSAAPSPASTASASRRSTRCACSSGRPSCRRFTR